MNDIYCQLNDLLTTTKNDKLQEAIATITAQYDTLYEQESQKILEIAKCLIDKIEVDIDITTEGVDCDCCEEDVSPGILEIPPAITVALAKYILTTGYLTEYDLGSTDKEALHEELLGGLIQVLAELGIFQEIEDLNGNPFYVPTRSNPFPVELPNGTEADMSASVDVLLTEVSPATVQYLKDNNLNTLGDIFSGDSSLILNALYELETYLITKSIWN